MNLCEVVYIFYDVSVLHCVPPVMLLLLLLLLLYSFFDGKTIEKQLGFPFVVRFKSLIVSLPFQVSCAAK